jgi:pseudouridine synthase
MIPAVQERLQKVLARAGFASRRGAEALMQEGRVTVNGAVVRELGTKADPAHDDVRVDGVRVKAAGEPVYIVLNKPRGVVTTRRDPSGRRTVMDLVPGVAGLFPVGRLDLTTEGLILLTNDGAFAERVSHPRFEVPRVYHAKVRGVPDAPTLARLRRGVRVEGDILVVDRVRLVEVDRHAWVEVTLHEGKQHEVKRLLEAVGHPVSKLRRVAFGPITLQRLAPGQYRNLEPAEVAGLLRGEGSPAELTRRPRRRRRAAARRKTGPGKAGAREATARKASVRKAGAGKAVSGKSDARRGSARKGNARGIGARKAGERTASGRTAGGRKAGGRTADSRARTRRPGTARSTRAPGRGGQSTVPPRGSRKRSGGAGRRGRR